jgi:hypothetical protein
VGDRNFFCVHSLLFKFIICVFQWIQPFIWI